MMEKDWTWISPDGNIKKIITSKTDYLLHPFDRSCCTVDFIEVTLEDEEHFEGCPQAGTTAEYVIGEGETKFERFLGRALTTMVQQEVSLFEFRIGKVLISVKIELIKHQLPSNVIHELTDKEKLAEAERFKGRASELISKNRYEDAEALLIRAFRFLSFAGGNLEENQYDLYFTIVANMSLCCLKQDQMERTVKLCDRVLTQRPDHIKCRLRRATALDNLQITERAKQDILAVLQIEPNNKGAQQLLERIKAHMTKQKAASTDLAKKMLRIDKKT